MMYGSGAIGSAAVSKTAGCRFESCLPCIGPTVACDKRGLFTDIRMASGENVSPFPVGPDIWYRER